MATEFWFKFNFKDWASDVKPLSLTARGLLMEIIIYMNNSKTFFVENDIRFLVRLSGGLTEEVTESIAEFKKFGILDFEQNEAGQEIIVSRRLRKFLEKSRINTENGQKGGNPTLKNKSRLTESDNQNANPPSNSISISNSNSDLDNKKAWFEIFWNAYGKKQDSKKCLEKWMKLSIDEINAALDKVDAYVASTPDVTYRKNPLTWLNGKCWQDEIIKPTTSAKATNFDKALNTDLHGMLIFDK
jgi:hypothetical protein